MKLIFGCFNFISKSGFNTPKRFVLEYNLFQFARANRFPQLAEQKHFCFVADIRKMLLRAVSDLEPEKSGGFDFSGLENPIGFSRRLKLPVAESEKFRDEYSVACCADRKILLWNF